MNTQGKTRPVEDPYEIWITPDNIEYRVLRKYQGPDTERFNPKARWWVAVHTPIMPEGDWRYEHVFVRELKRINGIKNATTN